MSNRGTDCSSSRAIAMSGMAWPRPRPREKNAMPNISGSNGFGSSGNPVSHILLFLIYFYYLTAGSECYRRFSAPLPDKIGSSHVEAVYSVGLPTRELAVRHHGRHHPCVPVRYAARLVSRPTQSPAAHRDPAA